MIYKLEEEFEEIERLRKNVDLNKLHKLAKMNKNDRLYSWAFNGFDVLYQSLEELKSDYSVEHYIHDIGLAYIEILSACQK